MSMSTTVSQALQYSDVRDALDQAPRHLDAQNGYPLPPAAGECEICDILWLLDNDEGNCVENLFHLRDAWRSRLEQNP
jgi:hypothetical protein